MPVIAAVTGLSAFTVSLLGSTPASAGGGKGGSTFFYTGGNGGTPTTPAGNGTGYFGGSGGGGGAVGQPGGVGGNSGGYFGGGNGGNGAASGPTATSITNTTVLAPAGAGGAGGNAGAGPAIGGHYGGGGGGGAGAYGFTVTGAGTSSNSSSGTITGGAGGAGGAGAGGNRGGHGGDGGDGGMGILFTSTSSGVTFNNAGGITGGAGGAGGFGGYRSFPGTGGTGGAGARFDGMGQFTNSGAVAGGVGGTGGAESPQGGGSFGGTGGAGVLMNGGGTLTNLLAGSIRGGAAGDSLSTTYGGNGGVGGAGVSGVGINIGNAGTIAGGLGGSSHSIIIPGYGGAGGAGITGTGMTVTNSGAIGGGNGGAFIESLFPSGFLPTTGTGGTGGAGMAVTNTTIINTNSIFGGNGGIGGIVAPPGAGGFGIIGSDLTISNSGAIKGGLSGDGLTQAYAIFFTGGINSVGGTGSILGGIDVAGGSFAPALATSPVGTPLSIGGPLTFAPGTSYNIRITPTAADSTTVTGVANLDGTVVVSSLLGKYSARSYVIVNAGSISGVFSGLTFNGNFPGGMTLDYSVPNEVLLDVSAGLNLLATPPGANVNQKNIVNGINNAIVNNATLPAGFQNFGLLTGPALLNALSQADGETATGVQQSTFNAMNQFMGVMTDPFVAGRGGGGTGGSGAVPFAAEFDAVNAYAARDPARSRSEREAYAAIYRKAPDMPAPFYPTWSVWAAGFGGSQTTNGNLVLGSNNTTSRVGAVAVGADYRFSPDTVMGFALAGGGTSFNVNGFGTGRSDLFQAGAFVRHTIGPAYITAALAYGWQDVTTDRTVTIAGIDQLRARFGANAYSGRVESGYRIAMPWMGVTPYAAAQFTTLDLPAYAEQAVVGANTFALAYGAKNVTDSRSEIGVRTDRSWAMTDSIFTLRGRFAWAHDYNTDRSIGATFQTLPGSTFVVNGATQSPDKALTTASAEVKWRSGLSLAATFEGEFSSNSTSYAGKGVARYQW